MGILTDELEAPDRRLTGRELASAAAIEAGVDRIAPALRTEYHEDPYKFLLYCVYTRDEADKEAPVKRWPGKACGACNLYWPIETQICPKCDGPIEELLYVKEIVKQWESGKPNVLLIPKPRRFKMSWLFTALHAWLAITRKESAIYFQSRTEQDSAFLIERVKFILENIPVSKMKVPKWKPKDRPPKLTFANGSQIVGKAEGKDVLRGVTATAILLDEVGFWQDARGSWNAIKPLVEGDCRISVVSSAMAGFWSDLVSGTLE